MSLSLAHQELHARHLRICLMRELAAGHIKLEHCRGPLIGELAAMMFTFPMLIRAHKDHVVLTQAGQDYLAACDPNPSSPA